MAKQKPGLFELSGTLGGFTFVQTSKGTILRRPRGSVTPASCNKRFQQEINRNSVVTPPAQLVHNCIKQHAGRFKKSDLWQDIQSLMRKRCSEDYGELLSAVTRMEINPKCRVESMLTGLSTGVDRTDDVMTLTVINRGVHLAARLEPDAYCCEAFILFADEACRPVDTLQLQTGWVKAAEPLQAITSFAVPPVASYYMVLLKVICGRKNVVMDDLKATGLQVVSAGRL